MSLASQVAELEAEVVRVRAMIADQVQREADIARRMYRRGYNAGHAAGRRGAPAGPHPERLARGDLRILLERVA